MLQNEIPLPCLCGRLFWHTPKLFERFKCEFKNENNRKKNWGTLFSLQHFGGKRGMLDLQDGD